MTQSTSEFVRTGEQFTTGQIAHTIGSKISDDQDTIQVCAGEYRREHGHWWCWYKDPDWED